MKTQLKDTQVNSMAELQATITRLWVLRMSDSDYMRSLVESMPRRLQEVIEKAGCITKY